MDPATIIAAIVIAGSVALFILAGVLITYMLNFFAGVFDLPPSTPFEMPQMPTSCADAASQRGQILAMMREVSDELREAQRQKAFHLSMLALFLMGVALSLAAAFIALASANPLGMFLLVALAGAFAAGMAAAGTMASRWQSRIDGLRSRLEQLTARLQALNEILANCAQGINPPQPVNPVGVGNVAVGQND